MKRLLILLPLFLLASASSARTGAQNRYEERTICKNMPVPVGYMVVGETDTKDCASAWVIRRKKAPTLTNEFKFSALPPKPIEWQLFTNPTKDFSVMMPGYPEGGSASIAGAYTDLYVVNSSKYMVMVMSSVIENNPNQPADPLAAIDNFLSGFQDYMNSSRRADGTKQEIVKERNLILGRLPGRQYRITTETISGYMRVYATKNRVYLLMYGAPKKSEEDARKFLDSFKVKAR